MSLRAIAWAWQVPGLPPPQKLVLLRLADAARDDGSEARPSVATIMNETGLGRTAVYQAIRALEAADHIEQSIAADRARHSPAVYRLKLRSSPGPQGVPGRVRETDPEAVPVEAVRVREADPAGSATRTRPGTPDVPNPSYTHPIPVQERSARVPEPNSETVETMFAIYRDVLGDVLPVPREITRKRASAAATRLRDSCGGDLEVWRHVCRQVAKSRFLTGGGPRRWKADIDWLLSRENLLKLSEGKYENRTSGGGSLLDAINNSTGG